MTVHPDGRSNDQPSAVQAMASASASMLAGDRVADVLAQLMTDCLPSMSAHAAAILVLEESTLSLLSASTHRVVELEMLQAQESEGPCVETIASGQPVEAVGATEMADRWKDVGPAIRDAGYHSVHAFPMRWHGEVFGGLNIFRTVDDEQREDTGLLGQAFADVATLVLVQAADVPFDQVLARVHEAVMARSVVEQAKGALAYLHDVDMEQAYLRLLERAGQHGHSLTETAELVLREQHE
ncbi:transcriptional regulator with GAF, ATPase, and Fis domain [Marmoricola sp. URHA0025 HA25]